MNRVGPAVVLHERHAQPTEDVVHDALDEGDFRVGGHSAGIEALVREVLDQRIQVYTLGVQPTIAQRVYQP